MARFVYARELLFARYEPGEPAVIYACLGGKLAGRERCQPGAVGRLDVTRAELKNYHERVAARLRAAASTTTTSGVKSRLLEKAEKHERLAVSEPEQEGNAVSLPAAEAVSRPSAVKSFRVQAQIEELTRDREQSADPMELVRETYHQAIAEAEARRKTPETDLPRPDPMRVGQGQRPRQHEDGRTQRPGHGPPRP